jgi:hypothetical protein
MTTVFDDPAADTLTGGGQDWFFAKVSGTGNRDVIVDFDSKLDRIDDLA